MTFCVAWKNRNGIYMVADSAVTSSDYDSSGYTSAGQKHRRINGNTVKEGALKIISINSEIMISIAGSVSHAKPLIDFIKEHYDIEKDICKLIEFAKNSSTIFPNERRNHYWLLIGQYHNNSANLYKWSSLSGNLINIPKIDSIGSLMSYYPEMILSYLKFFAESGFSEPNIFLCLAASLLQSLGLHHDLIAINVGGIIYGAKLDRNGFQWQKDTSYVIYHPELKSIEITSFVIRDNCLVVRSTMTLENRLLKDPYQNFDLDTYLDKWNSDLCTSIYGIKSHFYSFLSSKHIDFKVIENKKRIPECGFFSFQPTTNGVWKIKIKEPLSILLFDATKKKFNPFNVKFGYYNAENCDLQKIIKDKLFKDKYKFSVDSDGVVHIIDKVTKEYLQFSDHQLKTIPKK